jgi:hypothetical protein
MDPLLCGRHSGQDFCVQFLLLLLPFVVPWSTNKNHRRDARD